MASSGGKGHIPWTRLQHAQSDYICDEYLPPGITLTQYHHICVSDANALLQHWTAREAAGEILFRFKKVVNTSRQHIVVDTSWQNTGALVNGDNPANAEVENGMEEGPDETRNSQEQGSNSKFQGHGEELQAEPLAESGPSQVSLVIWVMANIDLLLRSVVGRVLRNLRSCRQKQTLEKSPPLLSNAVPKLASFAMSIPQSVILHLLTWALSLSLLCMSIHHKVSWISPGKTSSISSDHSQRTASIKICFGRSIKCL